MGYDSMPPRMLPLHSVLSGFSPSLSPNLSITEPPAPMTSPSAFLASHFLKMNFLKYSMINHNGSLYYDWYCILIYFCLYDSSPSSIRHNVLHMIGSSVNICWRKEWMNTMKTTVFKKSLKSIGGRKNMRKLLTEQAWLLSLLSSKESGTIIDHWPASGNVALRIFFMLVIDNFGTYT